MCLTEDQAQHVFETVQNGRPIQPYTSHVDIDQLVIENNDINPYHKGLCAMVNTELFQEPRLEMDNCDLNWSILSTPVEYATHRDLDSPYKDMNTSPLYNKIGEEDNLVKGPLEISDKKFEEVSCSLKTTVYYDDTNDVSTTYLGTYLSGDKPELLILRIIFLWMVEELLEPMKLFFDSGATRGYLSHTYYKASKALHKLPKFATTCTGIKIGNGAIV